MGMAIPRDAGGWASGMAAVRKGRMAREKERERYISDRKSWVSKRAEEDCRRLFSLGHSYIVGNTLEAFIAAGHQEKGYFPASASDI